jgi:hypothetical protein
MDVTVRGRSLPKASSRCVPAGLRKNKEVSEFRADARTRFYHTQVKRFLRHCAPPGFHLNERFTKYEF